MWEKRKWSYYSGVRMWTVRAHRTNVTRELWTIQKSFGSAIPETTADPSTALIACAINFAQDDSALGLRNVWQIGIVGVWATLPYRDPDNQGGSNLRQRSESAVIRPLSTAVILLNLQEA